MSDARESAASGQVVRVMEFLIGWAVGTILTFLGMRNILKQQEGYTNYWFENSQQWLNAFLKKDGAR